MTKHPEFDQASGRDGPALNGVRENASRFRFDSADDALNFARAGTEESNRRFARLSGSLAHCYLNGDLDLKVTFRLAKGSQECKFTLRGVPFGCHRANGTLDVASEAQAQVRKGVGFESPVYFTVPDFVKIGEDKVPAYIRFESQEELLKVFGMSIGVQTGPPIGAQKGPPLNDGRTVEERALRCARRREGGARPEARAAQGTLILRAAGISFGS